MEIVIAAIYLAAFVAGVLAASAMNPPTTTPASGSGASGPNVTCKDLCSAWDARRQDLCMALGDQAVALTRVNILQQERNAFLAVMVAAAAAAAVAAGTVYGAFLAPILLGIAAVAAGVALFLLGQVIVAMVDLNTKTAATRTAQRAVADARAALDARCTMEESGICLARPAPCAGS